MSRVNRTLLLSLISRCQQLLLTDMTAGGAVDDQTAVADDNGRSPANTTASTTTTAGSSSFDQRKSYDNAYFYILFVMLFYFVLAGTLFKNFLRSDERDPYAEFIMGSEPASTAGPAGKFNPGLASERLDFEEENSLC